MMHMQSPQQQRVMPSRAGILEKRGNMWLAWRQRYFVLKEGRLEYSKIGNTTPSGLIPLTKDWKVYPWKFPGRDFAVILKPPSKGEREYYLSALTSASQTEWVKDINTTIEYLQLEASAPRPTIPAPAPAVVPHSSTHAPANASTPAPTPVPTPAPAQVSAATASTTSATKKPNNNNLSQVPISSVVTPAQSPTAPMYPVISQPTQPTPAPTQPLYPAPSQNVVVEMSTVNPSSKLAKEGDDDAEDAKFSPPKPQTQKQTPKKSNCCRRCCATFCLWFSVILFLLASGISAALATSKLDPNSQVWGFIVSEYHQLVAKYYEVQSQVFALDRNYQIAIASGVAIVLLLLIVVPIVCCCRRRRRNKQAIENHTFSELLDDDTQTQKRSRGSCCKCFCWVLFTALLLAAIAVLTTSARDSNSQLWNFAVQSYNDLMTYILSLTSSL
eukprot:c10591_g1_i1.p1 GENE.c10591_g1_i1~~c10591_g1_i1.p1  ORF type:complete len:443 (+),score=92.24 c10591_g1_i1:85-1413(+)